MYIVLKENLFYCYILTFNTIVYKIFLKFTYQVLLTKFFWLNKID